MSQSNPNIELPEMPIPPEPPLEDEPTVVEVHISRDPEPTSAVQWPALQEFDSQESAFAWAFYQNKAGGPKYYVHKLNKGNWEAIQAWMMAF